MSTNNKTKELTDILFQEFPSLISLYWFITFPNRFICFYYLVEIGINKYRRYYNLIASEYDIRKFI